MQRTTLLGLATSLVCLLAGSAQAQDASPPSNWNGLYVGADVGYGFGHATQPYSIGHGTPLTSTEAAANQSGIFAGGFVGANWMIGDEWLVGPEGNWDWSDLNGNDHGSGGDVNAVKQRWEASARGRLGYLVSPQALLYVTAGWSWLNADLKKTNGAPVVTRSATFGGPTFGFGAESELTDDLTVRVQYRFSDYDRKRINMAPLGYDLGTRPQISGVSAGIALRL